MVDNLGEEDVLRDGLQMGKPHLCERPANEGEETLGLPAIRGLGRDVLSAISALMRFWSCRVGHRFCRAKPTSKPEP